MMSSSATAGGTLLGGKTALPSPKPGMSPPWSVPSLCPCIITLDELCSLCLKNAVQFGLDDSVWAPSALLGVLVCLWPSVTGICPFIVGKKVILAFLLNNAIVLGGSLSPVVNIQTCFIRAHDLKKICSWYLQCIFWCELKVLCVWTFLYFCNLSSTLTYPCLTAGCPIWCNAHQLFWSLFPYGDACSMVSSNVLPAF